MKIKTPISSVWTVEHIRDGKVISTEKVRNTVMNEGINHILNSVFRSATQITTWYVAIFSSASTPSKTDTYASHGWTEATTEYSQAFRPVFTAAAPVSLAISNTAAKAVFDFITSVDIYGAALVGGGASPDVKGNTTGGGTLMLAARFGAMKDMISTDTLRVTIEIEGADA